LTILLSKWRLRVTPSVVQFWFLNGFGFGSWGGSWVPQPMVLHFEIKSEMELGISLWLEPNLDQEPTPKTPLYTCSSSSFSKKIILNLFIGLGIDMLLV
jgi:hypothetical protein